MGKLNINNGGIDTNKVMPDIDERFGPYASIEAANTALGASGRDCITAGLTVGITQNDGSVKEYWYQPQGSGLALVPKQRLSGTHVAGDFASFDANGDLVDSGHKHSDYATAAQGAKANTAYQKPSGGIPSTDLASAVQTSLGKADTAVQQVTVGTTTTGAAGTNASVTNSGTATNPVLDFTIPRGADGQDGQDGQDGADAVNPFKGWWPDLATLKAAITAKPGDSAYVKDASPATTWSICVYDATASSDNYWADSGTDADTSNIQTFESGEEVNETYIDDTHLVNPKEGALPTAFDVLQLKAKLEGVTASETKATIGEQISGYINGNGVPTAVSSGSTTTYVVIALNNAKSVRLLGSTNANTGTNYTSYAFWNAATYVDSNTVVEAHNWDVREGSTNYAKEYNLSVPSGATHIAVSLSTPTNQPNFYCYLQSGKNLVDLINEQMMIDFYGEQESNTDVIAKCYISSNGSLTSTNDSRFKVIRYAIPEGMELAHIINSSHTSSTFRIYCFYNSSAFSSSSVVGTVGPTGASHDSDDYYVDIPTGATHLGVSMFDVLTPAVFFGKSDNVKDIVPGLVDEVDFLSSASVASLKNKIAFSYDGSENLFVAYNNGSGVEYLYWFKKCMANNLYTFYRVKYRNVTTRQYSSLDGVNATSMNGNSFYSINITSSDNIGPVSIRVSVNTDYYVGGNHLYPSNNAQNTYYTASCEQYDVYVDGVVLSSEQSGYADAIVVTVHNIIYDPSVAPSEGATSLSTKLLDEYVLYSVKKNSIEVSVRHEYVASSCKIHDYYGMQSMAYNDNSVLTPLGAYPDFTANASVSSFKKSAYPNFNRFIEKRNDVYYHAVYLYPYGIGSHSLLRNDDNIMGNYWSGSDGKHYHQMINLRDIAINGQVYSWKGSYTFNKTVVCDDTNMLVYIGVVNGKDTLFFSAKQAYSGVVSIPEDFAFRTINVIEAKGVTDGDGNTDFVVFGNNIDVIAEAGGSLILSFD